MENKTHYENEYEERLADGGGGKYIKMIRYEYQMEKEQDTRKKKKKRHDMNTKWKKNRTQ